MLGDWIGDRSELERDLTLASFVIAPDPLIRGVKIDRFRKVGDNWKPGPESAVEIIARTRDWLRYEVPEHFIRRDARGHYRGQKQIWFLLRLTGRDCDMNLRATEHPEFDAWRWNDYWVPLELVIEFKRSVYEMALTELARFLPRGQHQNRFLRSGMRISRRGGDLDNETTISPPLGDDPTTR